MTSLAEDEVRRINDGIYVPSSVIPLNEGGHFIQEDDNVDINVETIDGKKTFHSMACVVCQKSNGNAPVQHSFQVM